MVLRCTGAGLFSASAISSSNSATRSGSNRDTSDRPDRQRMTCSTAMTSAFRFAGAFPVATAYAWPAMKVYQPCRASMPVELLPDVPRPLFGRGQQPGLVELPGPHLAQQALRKRFLRNLELRLRRRHHTLDPVRGTAGEAGSGAWFPPPFRSGERFPPPERPRQAHPEGVRSGLLRRYLAFPVAGRRPEPLALPAGRRLAGPARSASDRTGTRRTATTGCLGSGFRRGRA